MGSVKDLKILQIATENKSGVGQFHYSDRYSVFDWGEMPDSIKDKGKALCMMGAFFFEKLEELGIETHYQGLVSNGKVKHLSDISTPVDAMQVSLVRILKPAQKDGKYDYSIYNQNETNILIPLEIIYRNSLPEGSSVFRRFEKGSLKLEDIGLAEMPAPGSTLEKPILDVSTKLEITDRYMTWNEAQKISALSDRELDSLKKSTKQINELITKQVGFASLINEDGKVEFGFNENRELMLLDVLGTPDECRFTFDGMPVSKEVARIYYRKTPWFDEVEAAKQKDRMNWKNLVKNPPPPLPPRFAQLVSQLYQSTCNEIIQKEWFKSPSMASILEEIQEFL